MPISPVDNVSHPRRRASPYKPSSSGLFLRGLERTDTYTVKVSLEYHTILFVFCSRVRMVTSSSDEDPAKVYRSTTRCRLEQDENRAVSPSHGERPAQFDSTPLPSTRMTPTPIQPFLSTPDLTSSLSNYAS